MADVQRHADAAGQGDAAFETASFLFTVLDDDYEAAHKRAASMLRLIYNRDFEKASKKYCLLGRPEDCLEQMRKFAKAGSRHYVFPMLSDPNRFLEEHEGVIRPGLGWGAEVAGGDASGRHAPTVGVARLRCSLAAHALRTRPAARAPAESRPRSPFSPEPFVQRVYHTHGMRSARDDSRALAAGEFCAASGGEQVAGMHDAGSPLSDAGVTAMKSMKRIMRNMKNIMKSGSMLGAVVVGVLLSTNAFAVQASLPTVAVVDSEPDGDFDQADIDAAMAACYPGCRLEFVAGTTYENVGIEIGAYPNGIVLTTSATNPATLESPLFEQQGIAWTPVITLLSTAPDGLTIENLVLDGRKHLQKPNASDRLGTATRATAIEVGNTRAKPVSHGKLVNLRIRDFVGRGIRLKDAPHWSVEHNVISGIGCYQGQEPCGGSLSPNPWDSVDDDDDKLPGRKTPGFGIMINTNSSHSIVSHNKISGTTKMAFEVFVPANHTCGSTYQTRELLVRDNHASNSVTGFTVNGGCFVEFRDNVASGMVAAGAEHLNVGNGFTCARDGEGSRWLDNESSDNQRAGYSITCEGNPATNVGALLFKGNIAKRNCTSSTQPTQADIEFRPRLASAGPLTGLTVVGNDVVDSGCVHRLYVDRWSDVEVDGRRVESVRGGSTSGLEARP